MTTETSISIPSTPQFGKGLEKGKNVTHLEQLHERLTKILQDQIDRGVQIVGLELSFPSSKYGMSCSEDSVGDCKVV